MFSTAEREAIIALIKREVVPAIGCTEPVAVSLCVARATELLGTLPEKIDVYLSPNILKNAMGVGIPGTGMIGLPMDMYSNFPKGQKILLLTAQAAKDGNIMNMIKEQLRSGREVVITSSLLKAIPEKIAEVSELRCTDLKAIVNDFGRYGKM